nr:lytic transglycosylase domain-containing protein [uncultured Roseateles sp.]
MTARRKLFALMEDVGSASSVFVKDIAQGLLVVSHNTLALLGLGVVALLMTVTSQHDLRHRIETKALGWLNARQEARAEADGNTLYAVNEPDAVSRATASNPKELPRQQAAVAHWLAKRYKVAPEPISRLVQEAWTVGQRARVEPTLILAIIAIESSFNPFAQSPVGAQGLMQVLTRVHDDKYTAFGGNLAAFDPLTNLRVGVQVLKECIQRAGGIEEGLRYYVGAANMNEDGGYAGRVLAEQEQLKAVMQGQTPRAAPTRELLASNEESSTNGQRVALAH